MIPPFQVWQCQQSDCRFRFPVTDNRVSGKQCPACGGEAVLDGLYPASFQPQAVDVSPITLEVLLDNIRSVYNVGSMFRTADGAGVGHMHLCGITPPPDHRKIAKTALGAETAVPYTRYTNGLETAVALKQQGCQLWALEATPTSKSLLHAVSSTQISTLALVVGNEIAGVDPAILAICDQVVHLPMQGRKESLNVASAFAVAAYQIRLWGNRRIGSPSFDDLIVPSEDCEK